MFEWVVVTVMILFMIALQIKVWREWQPPAMLLVPGAIALVLELYLALKTWVLWGLGLVALLILVVALMEGGFLFLASMGVLVSRKEKEDDDDEY